MLEQRVWPTQTPLRQLAGLPLEAYDKLEAKKKLKQEIEDAQEYDDETESEEEEPEGDGLDDDDL